MCHRNIFKIFSQNPAYLESFCSNLNNPFHFACRKWYLDNQSPEKSEGVFYHLQAFIKAHFNINM